MPDRHTRSVRRRNPRLSRRDQRLRGAVRRAARCRRRRTGLGSGPHKRRWIRAGTPPSACSCIAYETQLRDALPHGNESPATREPAEGHRRTSIAPELVNDLTVNARKRLPNRLSRGNRGHFRGPKGPPLTNYASEIIENRSGKQPDLTPFEFREGKNVAAGPVVWRLRGFKKTAYLGGSSHPSEATTVAAIAPRITTSQGGIRHMVSRRKATIPMAKSAGKCVPRVVKYP